MIWHQHKMQELLSVYMNLEIFLSVVAFDGITEWLSVVDYYVDMLLSFYSMIAHRPFHSDEVDQTLDKHYQLLHICHRNPQEYCQGIYPDDILVREAIDESWFLLPVIWHQHKLRSLL